MAGCGTHTTAARRRESVHSTRPAPVEADTVALLADEGAAELEDAMLSRVATKPSVTVVPSEDCPYRYVLHRFGSI